MERCKHDMIADWCSECAPMTYEDRPAVAMPTVVRVEVEDTRITIARETGRLMPELFVSRYAELVEMAVGVTMGGQHGEPDMPKGPLDRPTSAYGGVIRDVVAHRYRQAVDGQLRALSRDVRFFLTTSPKERQGIVERTAVKCGGCAKFIDHDWKYCSWCGKKVMKV